jgi:hypothetical protein
MNRLVRGDRQHQTKTFLRDGLAAELYLRRHASADGTELPTAALENGLPKIDLVRRQVQPGLRTVEIKTGG